MELPIERYDKGTYIETNTKNKISRHSTVCGTQNIVLGGKSIVHAECVIRGDLKHIQVGKYCILSKRSVIRPPHRLYKGEVVFFKLEMEDYVVIGEDSVVAAAKIGSYVQIGKNCVIGARCILKDCCRILDNTVLPPDTVVPPFAVFGGNPGTLVDQLPESAKLLHQELAQTLAANFVPQ
ncbi:dynactin 4 [Capsaspora owczarzaki ATCC 30864]|uniref:dynactin 4 n=1 Tax=Capsaspora owczarzaki (strain ATCC 30864) TaxID=595528 RepID=UPI0001FE2B0C|nr:dynactin 4 [Capsaspora owczarzaki ATCC 30864]|eukprot:XP_004346742.1 dynactin 4 [Capsaspora owczarzaki ATCC 30864]